MRNVRNQMSLSVFVKGKKVVPGNYRQVSLSSILHKAMEQINVEIISKHVKDRKVKYSA